MAVTDAAFHSQRRKPLSFIIQAEAAAVAAANGPDAVEAAQQDLLLDMFVPPVLHFALGMAVWYIAKLHRIDPIFLIDSVPVSEIQGSHIITRVKPFKNGPKIRISQEGNLIHGIVDVHWPG